MSVTCGRSVVFSWYSGFLHQLNWPPRYNWNIVGSGVKHHNPNNTHEHYKEKGGFEKVNLVVKFDGKHGFSLVDDFKIRQKQVEHENS